MKKVENIRLGEPITVSINPSENTITFKEENLSFDLWDFLETIQSLLQEEEDQMIEDIEGSPVFIERDRDWVVFHLKNSYFVLDLKDLEKIGEYIEKLMEE